MDGWMDGQRVRYKDEWIDGRKDGWKEQCFHKRLDSRRMERKSDRQARIKVK